MGFGNRSYPVVRRTAGIQARSRVSEGSFSSEGQICTPEGKHFDGLTGGIGGGGLFIESSVPLPVGSELMVEFALPDCPLETITTKCKVAWVRPKPDRFTLYPGMGVQFTDISQKARDNVMALVKSLIQVRQMTLSAR